MKPGLDVPECQGFVMAGMEAEIGKVADPFDPERDIEGLGGRDGLADIQGFDLGQSVGMFFHEIRPTVQVDGTLSR